MTFALPSTHFAQYCSVPRISLYLAAKSWAPEPDPGGTVWTSSDGEFEVFIPANSAMRGFQSYVLAALDTLAKSEDRPAEQIALEINKSDADVQYVRINPESDPGTTPITEGVEAFEHVRQWVLSGAVAVSADQARLIQPTRKPQQALDFMRRVQLGPTLAGSYVLTVYIPVPPLIGQSALDIDDPAIEFATQPFERRVSLTLRSATLEAISAADEVIRLRKGIESFTSRADRGVSANLCEALSGMTAGHGHDLDISFSWALSRPMAASSIRVTPHHVEVLQEVAQELRSKSPEDDVRLVGGVVRLHRDSTFGAGEVSIAGCIEGDESERMRRVWLELSEEDYATAVRAHKTGRYVAVGGGLVRRGNRYLLQNPTGFQLLDEPL